MSELVPEGAEVEQVESSAEPAWQGPTQSEWEETQAQLGQYAELMQQLQPQQPQYVQGPPVPDPFSETYADDLQTYLQAQLAPLQQFVVEQQIAQGEQQAMEMLGEIAARDGEFDKEMAWAMAQNMAATRGAPSNDRESQQLLAEAAKQIREYERRVGEAYHQQQIEQIQTVAGAPRGMPAGQPGAQTVTAGGYGNVPYAVANRFFGNNGN